MSKNDTQPPFRRADHGIEEKQMGVYRVYLEKENTTISPETDSLLRAKLSSFLTKWVRAYTVIIRLFKEVLSLAPYTFFVWVLVGLWCAIPGVVLTSLENRILRIIEQGISTHSMDIEALLMALVSRLAFAALNILISSVVKSYVDNSLKTLLSRHFSSMIFVAQIRMDLSTVQKNASFDHLDPDMPFRLMGMAADVLGEFIGGASHLGLILFVTRTSSGSHGLVLALVSFLRPAITLFKETPMWTTPRVIEATNKHYLRMLSLKELADSKYRLDIISGNIVQYIIDQFTAASKALGNESTERVELQSRTGFLGGQQSLLTGMLGELTMVYFVIMAVLNPSEISLATFATIQAASNAVERTYWHVSLVWDMVISGSAQVQQIFALQESFDADEDGHVPYPREESSEKGMSFELRNVTFQYPGSTSANNALEDVSFKIGAGELVVIVGANGSGKSTFVNILSRLYNPTSGQVLVDGVDLKDYKLSDIRQATATLTQDHQLYPLSLKENVGLGYVDEVGNDEMITEAVRQGGAERLVSKLENGLDTVLEPKVDQYWAFVIEGSDSPLAEKVKQLKKKSNVSGGERQRLVASRTFMRFKSEKVKFVAVDEPTSALDPEGELELFTQLRKARKGKTMLFITHRFGPLTKYADRIICLKEGRIVESGGHSELMELKGEYHKMYSIQAKAFESEP